MKFVTFNQLNSCIYANLHRIPRDIDMIVGIPRSGTMAANIIALYLNLPFMDVQAFCKGFEAASGNTRKCSNWIKSRQEARKILLVDDSISSGKAMREAKTAIKTSGYHHQIITLAVYALAATCWKVDIFFQLCEQPRMFEWNYMHHWALEYSCVDLDGVICENPKIFENDDGKNYVNFLRNARPKFIPTHQVGAIVTCRLEKYRHETEEWLKKYKVEYNRLIMLELREGKQRWSEKFDHAQYKAEVYKNSKYIFFIESSYEQALNICHYSNKQVFSVENRKLITPQNVIALMKCKKEDWIITAKRIVKKILNRVDYVK